MLKRLLIVSCSFACGVVITHFVVVPWLILEQPHKQIASGSHPGNTGVDVLPSGKIASVRPSPNIGSLPLPVPVFGWSQTDSISLTRDQIVSGRMVGNKREFVYYSTASPLDVWVSYCSENGEECLVHKCQAAKVVREITASCIIDKDNFQTLTIPPNLAAADRVTVTFFKWGCTHNCGAVQQ